MNCCENFENFIVVLSDRWPLFFFLNFGFLVFVRALHADEYNNVTATYYLLAERLLRSQAAAIPPLNLEEEEFISVSTHFSNATDTVDSKSGGRTLNRNRRTNAGKRPALDLSFVQKVLEEMEEEEGEDITEDTDLEPHSHPNDPSSSSSSKPGNRANSSPRYSPSTSRRLTSAKSSPHLLLNKIKEEVYAGDAEDDFLDEAFFLSADLSLRHRERHITSPDRLKRIERSRRQRSRSGSGSSQTSSDTSDTDEVVAKSSSGQNLPSRLPFSRHRHHRHHHDRNRSQSSCSRLGGHSGCGGGGGGGYSRESSENESPTRASAPVLFFAGAEDRPRDAGMEGTAGMKRRIPPVLQHSQSLVIIPCCGTRVRPEDDDAVSVLGRSAKKKHHLVHRPHSLPPVAHFAAPYPEEGRGLTSHHSNSPSPNVSRIFIRQQCWECFFQKKSRPLNFFPLRGSLLECRCCDLSMVCFPSWPSCFLLPTSSGPFCSHHDERLRLSWIGTTFLFLAVSYARAEHTLFSSFFSPLRFFIR